MVVLFCLSMVTSGLAAAISPDQVEFFESRIRPILAQDCYECHSTATKQKGGLNLDHRAAWQAGGDSGPAIVPGNPNDSLLIQAIRHDDEDLAMPKSGAKLENAIVRDFVRWIQMGAPDPRDQAPSPEQVAEDQDWTAVLERRKSWWSFQPINPPNPPTSSWSHHPVDQFIDAKRSPTGLEPNPTATPNVLLRRLSFALTGLPPTPDQVTDFLSAYQNNPNLAWANQVDRLLASPHFGERWARHWMDWIRYAESHGSEGDPGIVNAHLYRDYLIRALNDDVPYDQLLREHVAGDLLETPRTNSELAINESVIGTAHWRMVFHGFAPTDALDEKVRFTDDQINVFSKAFLGLTVSCARCHNHKFDAISQEDYYALFGIMGSTRPGRKAIDLPENLRRHRYTLQDLKPKIRESIANDWLNSSNDLGKRLLASVQERKDAPDNNSLLYPLHQFIHAEDPSATWEQEQSRWRIDEQAWNAHQTQDYIRHWDLGTSEDRETWFKEGTGLLNPPAKPGDFSLFGEGDLAVSGIHSSGTLTHLISSKHGGLLTSPDFNLENDYEVWLRLKGAGRSMSRYVVFNYPRNGTVYPVREMGNNKASWHWERYDLEYWRGDDIHLEITTGADAPLLVRNEARSWFGISEAVVTRKGGPAPPKNPRRFLAPVFSEANDNTTVNQEQLVEAYAKAIREAIQAWNKDQLGNDQAELLDACLKLDLLPNTIEDLPNAEPLLKNYRELENDIPVPTRIPTVAEWTAKDQPLYDRGNHKRPLQDVPRRFLEAIDARPYKTALSGRRQLAEDLLRPDNPLTRRVIVNRVWHHLFGQGIVSTPDNFGRLGTQPTHPELLDHLANYLSTEADWSLKRLIRYLVTTKTWQLSGEPSSLAQAQDPDNQRYSHFSVKRLEAEAIRDSLLHVSGRLDPKVFGNPVDGRQPRRSVYVRVIRNRLDPFLNTFDAPVPFSTQGRRSVTTVPGQSLTMMNSDFVVSTARSWGQSLAADAQQSALASTIKTAWQRAFSRLPSQQELHETTEFIRAQQEDYATLATMIAKQQSALANTEAQLAALLETADQRVQATIRPDTSHAPLLDPIAQWLFDDDARDSIGDLNLDLRGRAQIENGALLVGDGDSFAVSPKLPIDLKAKSLEVWLQLDDLEQRGGGAMSVQTPGGGEFDSIVFAERESRRWVAGSNHFARTKDFDGEPENEAREHPIHLTITYADDGTITGYRNGKVYGEPYRSSGPLHFRKDQAEVVFGIRHGYGGGGRLLKGRILEARLYDRALTAEEVAATATRQTHFVTQDQRLAALTPAEHRRWRAFSQRKIQQKTAVDRLADIAPQAGEDEVWTDLALAIFNMKEFIYVR